MLSFIFCCGPSVICIIKENKLKVRKKQNNEKKKDIFSLDMPQGTQTKPGVGVFCWKMTFVTWILIKIFSVITATGFVMA